MDTMSVASSPEQERVEGRLYNRELTESQKIEQKKILDYISDLYYERDTYKWDL